MRAGESGYACNGSLEDFVFFNHFEQKAQAHSTWDNSKTGESSLPRQFMNIEFARRVADELTTADNHQIKPKTEPESLHGVLHPRIEDGVASFDKADADESEGGGFAGDN